MKRLILKYNSGEFIMKYSDSIVKSINDAITSKYKHLTKITNDMKLSRDGVSRLVMLDRYSQKDHNLKTLKVGDLVLTLVKQDDKYPTKGIGTVTKISRSKVSIKLDEEFWGSLTGKELETKIIMRSKNDTAKPLEIYFEQIATRVGTNLAQQEKTQEAKDKWSLKISQEILDLNIIPAGRVLFGAGSGFNVTYFNCFVMPYIEDSRMGISRHREKVMEIMSRGGGVGTNGSTLRPRGSSAKGVGGKSSGAVSWLNDIANLTHLVEQGGSRRGAQMIMLADWHPDILEFMISKMQNSNILKHLKNNSPYEYIRKLASEKLVFKSLSHHSISVIEKLFKNENQTLSNKSREIIKNSGVWEVNNPEFLSGANISIAISDDFMTAVENDSDWDLKFPDIDNFTVEEKKFYDEKWHEIGDVREWEALGKPVKIHLTLKAKILWDLINFCATYSAEPGVFFIDTANKMTNAKAYGQKVVCTNPCGEQPLAPYSVCNLAAINLANFVNHQTGEILFDKLKESVRTCVRMQDNVIDATPYFLDENSVQALGERRLGMGIMGLHDMLIWAGQRYGSKSANLLVDKVMRCITETGYLYSIELSKEKGSFPFLKDRENMINTGFVKNLNDKIKEGILKYGIRNSHILTIAPTGSTGTMVGVSTGLEPYFAFKYYRSGRLGKFMEVNQKIVQDWSAVHNFDVTKKGLPAIFVSAMELSPKEHVGVQLIIQKWVDSSISKTVNAPKGYTVSQVEDIYYQLYKGKAKGGTVYVDGSRESQILTLNDEENNLSHTKIINDDKKNQEIDNNNEEQITKLNEKIDGNLRGSKMNRSIGVEIDNICPICNEGIVKEIGGCNSCINCGVQLKCGL